MLTNFLCYILLELFDVSGVMDFFYLDLFDDPLDFDNFFDIHNQ